MTALVLDTRALEVIADPKTDLQAARHMRDMLTSAIRITTGKAVARQAGGLRYRDRLNSCHR
jgi:hypothetical protein